MAIVGYVNKIYTYINKEGHRGEIPGVIFTSPSGQQDFNNIEINGQPTYDKGFVHTQLIKGKNRWQTRKMARKFHTGLQSFYGFQIYNLRFLDKSKRVAAITYIIN